MGAPKSKAKVTKSVRAKKSPPKKLDARKTTKRAKTAAIPKLLTSETGCCDDCCCTNSAGGAIKSCEDGVCVDINVPSYFAVLVYDPSKPAGLPYWEKPENFPPMVIQALVTQIIANLTFTQKADLYTAIAPYVSATCSTACGP